MNSTEAQIAILQQIASLADGLYFEWRTPLMQVVDLALERLQESLARDATDYPKSQPNGAHAVYNGR